MTKIRAIISIFILLAAALVFAAPATVRAEDPNPPTPIIDVSFPCPDTEAWGLGTCGGEGASDIAGYIIRLYQFSIFAAGILAVGLIVAGSLYLATAGGSADRQSEGKEMITSALWGIVLLFSSYLILRTVNPKLVTLANPEVPLQKLPDCEYENSSNPNEPTNSPCKGSAADIALKNQCKPFKEIGPWSSGVAQGTCAYRKSIQSKTFSVGSDDYYDEDEEVPGGSTIWTYPYFISSKGTSTAYCLAYAYQKKGEETKFINLNPQLELCASQKQEPTTEELKNELSCDPNESIPSTSYKDTYDAFKALNPGLSFIQQKGFYFSKDNNIYLSASGKCIERCDSTCTSLEGIPKAVVFDLVDTKKDCDKKWKKDGRTCEVVITGGTETGHQTHGIGKPVVDLRTNLELGSFLKANAAAYNIEKICTTAAESVYRYNCDEFDEKDSHLHVKFY